MEGIHQRDLLAVILQLMAFRAGLSLSIPIVYSFATLILIGVVTLNTIGISLGVLFVCELYRRPLSSFESILVIYVDNIVLSS